jgi:hypothetical protein
LKYFLANSVSAGFSERARQQVDAPIPGYLKGFKRDGPVEGSRVWRSCDPVTQEVSVATDFAQGWPKFLLTSVAMHLDGLKWRFGKHHYDEAASGKRAVEDFSSDILPAFDQTFPDSFARVIAMTFSDFK